MITLALQTGVTLLLLAFSVFSLRAARRMAASSSPAQTAGWHVAGVVFLLYGVNKLVQGTYGTAAYFAGPDAAVYTSYLRLAPMFNHSRTLLMFVLYGMLGWLAFKRRLTPSSRAVLFACSAAALLLGGWYGYVEGSLLAGRHFSATALVDTAGFIILAVLLFTLMLRDTADRLLWLAVAVYGFTSMLGVLFLAAMAWLDTPGTWAPPYWAIELCRFVLAGIMAGCAVRRYVLARRRASVPGLLPPSRQLQPSLM
jgi:hypothetical protein